MQRRKQRPRVKGASLVGKRVELVPWHKTFREKDWILRGRLQKIKAVRDKGRTTHFYIIKPDRSSVWWLHRGALEGKQGTLTRLVTGHKIRKG